MFLAAFDLCTVVFSQAMLAFHPDPGQLKALASDLQALRPMFNVVLVLYSIDCLIHFA
jgi:hypothetical protein